MPQLPSCFPPLPPSALQLRSYELYRSSIFLVLIKTDKSCNITFEYFDVREDVVDQDLDDDDDEIDKKYFERSKVKVRKKMGYIVTSMVTTEMKTRTRSSMNNSVETNKNKNEDNFNNEMEMSTTSIISYQFSYPSFKGIYLGEEYRNQQVIASVNNDKHSRSISQLMMGVYYKFLKYLYDQGVSSPVIINSHEILHQISSENGESEAKVLSHIMKSKNIYDHNNAVSMSFVTGCAMRKVLVCKLLSSDGWEPCHTKKCFNVVVLPRHISQYARLTKDNSKASKYYDGHDKTTIRISSPFLTISAMQSKLFTPRVCQSQQIELVDWRDVTCSVNSAVKGVSDVSVNCVYSLHVETLLAIDIKNEKFTDGRFCFEPK